MIYYTALKATPLQSQNADRIAISSHRNLWRGVHIVGGRGERGLKAVCRLVSGYTALAYRHVLIIIAQHIIGPIYRPQGKGFRQLNQGNVKQACSNNTVKEQYCHPIGYTDKKEN